MAFRVRHGSGPYLLVSIKPGDSAADIKEAVAATVGLPVGTFVAEKGGVRSPFRGDLLGDWDIVLLPAEFSGHDIWAPALAAFYPSSYSGLLTLLGGDAASGRHSELPSQVVEPPPLGRYGQVSLPWWRWFGTGTGKTGGHRD